MMTDFVTENTTPVNSKAETVQEPIDHARNYKIKLIERLIEHVKRSREFIKKFDDLFGGLPGNSDTCSYRFVDDLLDDHVKFVATLVGDTKAGLDWFLFENECGDKGHEAGIDEGEMRPIKTVEDYLWLVGLDQEGV